MVEPWQTSTQDKAVSDRRVSYGCWWANPFPRLLPQHCLLSAPLNSFPGQPCLHKTQKLFLLHALIHVPVNKGMLGIHQVKFVVQMNLGLSHSCGVSQHAHSSLDPGQISTHHSGRLITTLKPVRHQSTNWMLPLVLIEGGNGNTDIFGNNGTADNKPCICYD